MRGHRIAAGALAALVVLGAVAIVFWQVRVVAPALATDRATDLFKEHYPTASAGFAALREGRLPLWNPDQLTGVPFLAVPYAGLLYPGNVAYLVLAPETAIDVTELAHLVLAGVCMWLLVAELGLGLAPRYAAALTLMLSGWMGSQLHFPTLVQGMAWLPATVLAVQWSLQRPSSAKGAWALPFLSGVVALQVLNGSTEFLAYNLVAAGGWAACELVPRAAKGEGRRAVLDGGWLVAAVVLGVGLASVQLLPTLELVAQSTRAEGVSLREALYRGTVPPTVFLADTLATTGEVAVGVLPFVGLVLGAGTRWRRIWLYAVVLGVLAMGLVFGGTVYEVYFATPLGQWFRRPNKWLHLYAFAAAWLAAIGLGRLDGWRAEAVEAGVLWRRPVWLAALAGLAAAALLGALLGEGWNPHLLLVLALLAAFGSVSRSRVRVACVVALVVVQGADLFVATRGIWVRPSARPDLLDREAPLFDTLGASLGEGRIHLSAAYRLDPALSFKQGTLRGLPVVMDKQPLAMRRHGEFFSRAAGLSEAAEGWAELSPTGPWRLLDLASTRYYVLEPGEPLERRLAVLARTPARSGIRRVELESSARVYERTGWLPRAHAVGRARVVPPDAVLDVLTSRDFDPRTEVVLEGASPSDLPPAASDFRAAASIVVDTPERVEVEVTASAPGILVLTDSDYPGWRATVNGHETPILRANALFRAVVIDAGASRVVFRYAPGSLRAGAWLSGASLLGLAGLAWRGRTRRWR